MFGVHHARRGLALPALLLAVAVSAVGGAGRQAAATPVRPSNLQSTAITATSIDLSWTDNFTGETATQITWSAADPVSYATIDLPANTTSYQKTGLAPATAYRFFIRTCVDSSCTGWSGGKQIATLPAGGALAAPTSLGIDQLDTSSAKLSWTSNAPSATAQQFAYAPHGTSAFTFIDLDAEAAGWTHSGLTSGQAHDYFVRSCQEAYCSPWSGGIAVTIPNAGVAAAAPVGFFHTGLTTGSVTYTWADAANNETHFETAFRPQSGSFVYGTRPVNAESWTVSGLTAGQTYYAFIRACNGSLCSDWQGVGTTIPTGTNVLYLTGFSCGEASDGGPDTACAWDYSGAVDTTRIEFAWSRTSPIAYTIQTYNQWQTGVYLADVPFYNLYAHVRGCNGSLCSAWAHWPDPCSGLVANSTVVAGRQGLRSSSCVVAGAAVDGPPAIGSAQTALVAPPRAATARLTGQGATGATRLTPPAAAPTPRVTARTGDVPPPPDGIPAPRAAGVAPGRQTATPMPTPTPTASPVPSGRR